MPHDMVSYNNVCVCVCVCVCVFVGRVSLTSRRLALCTHRPQLYCMARIGRWRQQLRSCRASERSARTTPHTPRSHGCSSCPVGTVPQLQRCLASGASPTCTRLAEWSVWLVEGSEGIPEHCDRGGPRKVTCKHNGTIARSCRRCAASCLIPCQHYALLTGASVHGGCKAGNAQFKRMNAHLLLP